VQILEAVFNGQAALDCDLETDAFSLCVFDLCGAA